MKTSETTIEIFKALIGFQKEVTKISKTSTNPFFKSKYADLSDIQDVIKEPLINNGLGYIQLPVDKGGLTTRVFHESGEWIEATYFMDAVKNDPQGWGSVQTYQRRYALGAVFALNIDNDDDGNAASKKGEVDKKEKSNSQEIQKKIFTPANKNWNEAKKKIYEGTGTIDQLLEIYIITEEHQKLLLSK